MGQGNTECMAESPWSKTSSRKGEFKRKESEFQNQIGGADFPAVPNRYHLIVSYACPWAHRTLIHREMLGLTKSISVEVVDWHMEPNGSWKFDASVPGCTPSVAIPGAKNVQEMYLKTNPEFAGIGTVPILWDTVSKRIVNNESRQIIRMLNTYQKALGGSGTNLAPESHRAEIDAAIDSNYHTINNGVYKVGFARSQEAYDGNIEPLFARLDELEFLFANREFLAGPGRGVMTEADVCLFVTLLRFDPVYHTHFKCNKKLIREFPNLHRFIRAMAQHPKIRPTIHMDHILGHYYWSHESINTFRIVPWHLEKSELAHLGIA